MKNVYILKDSAGCCVNLVIGKKKALLFDTGSGIDNMYGAIRELTELPLIVIASHGHFDHIGGSCQFKIVYLSALDFSLLKMYTVTQLNGWLKDMAGKTGIRPFHSAPQEWRCIHELDFDTFDLGGLKCRILDLQGHTKGSVGVLITDLKLLLSGDALLPVMCLNFQNHLSKEVQYQTLVNMQKLKFEYYLTSHHDRMFPKCMIQRLMDCIVHSRQGKYHAYKYPYPPYEEGWIYLDSLEEEPTALIISNSEYMADCEDGNYG